MKHKNTRETNSEKVRLSHVGIFKKILHEAGKGKV